MKKRVIALALCVLMLDSVLAACGSGSSGSGGAAAPAGSGHKEPLVIGTAEDINNLNLQQQKTANNNIILKTTHQTLVFFNNDPEAESRFDPGLATDWEFTDDTHILMHLRNDVYFNDGEKTPLVFSPRAVSQCDLIVAFSDTAFISPR